MATWHPTITALEVFDARRENYDEHSPSVTTVLQVAAEDYANFARDLVIDGMNFPLEFGFPFILRAVRCEIVQDKGRYINVDIGGETLAAENNVYIAVTYATDNRLSVEFLGQLVLWEERWSPASEFITIDYNHFEWEDGIQLFSPDESPARLVKYFNVDVTVSRIDTEETVGSGLGCIFEILSDLSGKVNNGSYSFPGLSCVTFEAEEVLFSFDDMQRTVNYGGMQWSNLRLKFSIKHDSNNPLYNWNTFFRPKKLPDGSGGCDEDTSGFYKLRYKADADCPDKPIFYPYERVDFDPIMATLYP